MHKYFPPLANILISDKNKTLSVGHVFDDRLSKKLVKYLKNIEVIFSGFVTDQVKDGRLVGKVVVNLITKKELEGMDVLLNYKNAKDILEKHGRLDRFDLVLTVNQPDFVILNEGKMSQEVLNYIKLSYKSYVVVSATRINGFAIITSFDRLMASKNAKKYLVSLIKRGILLYSSGGAAFPSCPSVLANRVQRAFLSSENTRAI